MSAWSQAKAGADGYTANGTVHLLAAVDEALLMLRGTAEVLLLVVCRALFVTVTEETALVLDDASLKNVSMNRSGVQTDHLVQVSDIVHRRGLVEDMRITCCDVREVGLHGERDQGRYRLLGHLDSLRNIVEHEHADTGSILVEEDPSSQGEGIELRTRHSDGVGVPEHLRERELGLAILSHVLPRRDEGLQSGNRLSRHGL